MSTSMEPKQKIEKSGAENSLWLTVGGCAQKKLQRKVAEADIKNPTITAEISRNVN